MRTITLVRHSSLLAFVLGTASLQGCGQPVVSGQAQIDGRSQSLSGALMQMSGTYHGCLNVADEASWVACFGINECGAPSVVQGDTACQLKITSVQDAGTTYLAASPLIIPVGGNFNGVAMKFTEAANPQNNFYADVLMLPANYAANFVIDFLHGKSPSLGQQTVSPNYQMREATVVVDDSILAPDYTLSFPPVPYLKTAGNLLLSLSATPPTLSQNANGQAAESFTILDGACPIDPHSVYPVTPTPIATALSLADFGISVNMTISPAMPLERCLVAAHCDIERQDLCSYQMFGVSFN